jgi:hypothetical protein
VRAFVAKYEASLARLRPGQRPPALGSIGGVDASGTVSCSIDDSGTVTRLEIGPSWWTAVGPHRIADAVLDAYRFATSKVMAVGLIRARHGLFDDEEGRRGLRPGAGLLGEASNRGPVEGVDEMWRSIAVASAALAEAEQNHRAYLELRERRSERRLVVGPGRLFRLVLSGDEIVGAEARGDELGPQDGPRLAADARAAFETAQRWRTARGRN